MHLDALKSMISAAGVAVVVTGGSMAAAVNATALINYDHETLDPDWEERQRTTVLLLRSEAPVIPNNATITEADTGVEHRVINVKIAPHHALCYCEIRAARAFSGPFKRTSP